MDIGLRAQGLDDHQKSPWAPSWPPQLAGAYNYYVVLKQDFVHQKAGVTMSTCIRHGGMSLTWVIARTPNPIGCLFIGINTARAGRKKTITHGVTAASCMLLNQPIYLFHIFSHSAAACAGWKDGYLRLAGVIKRQYGVSRTRRCQGTLIRGSGAGRECRNCTG